MWKHLTIAMLLLSGCATTVGSADAICSIEPPKFTMDELSALSEETLSALDVFAEKFRRACGL